MKCSEGRHSAAVTACGRQVWGNFPPRGTLWKTGCCIECWRRWTTSFFFSIFFFFIYFPQMGCYTWPTSSTREWPWDQFVWAGVTFSKRRTESNVSCLPAILPLPLPLPPSLSELSSPSPRHATPVKRITAFAWIGSHNILCHYGRRTHMRPPLPHDDGLPRGLGRWQRGNYKHLHKNFLNQ